MGTPLDRHPTRRAIKACAAWLAFCLQIGWERSKLNALERIWWQHHDDDGRLT